MRCGAFGDMVLMTPIIRELAARFGSPVDLVSSGSWTRPLLAGQPGVGDIHMLVSRRRPYLLSPDQWSVVRALRERGPGPTWFLDTEGIGRKILTRAGISAEWIVEADDHPRRGDEHLIDRLLRTIDTMPAALTTPPPPLERLALSGTALEVPAHARQDLAQWLTLRGLARRPLLLLQAGNKRTMRRGARQRTSNTKYWPEAHWAQVLRAMHARCPDHGLVLLGVPAEHDMNEAIRRLTPDLPVLNAAHELPIGRLIALLNHASALVSVDTGPAHAAAAVGLPMVVLFAVADPNLYRPRGAADAPVICVRPDPPGPLEGLAPEQVVTAFSQLVLRPFASIPPL
jgi:heptosyltransferase-2/heptosyltransferase-3